MFLNQNVFNMNIFNFQEYEDIAGNKDRFQDSQFLVFVNRILAFLMSGLYLIFQRQPQHKAPLYKYVFCSLSNIMSSWCQYEALKYVSFPTQVITCLTFCLYFLSWVFLSIIVYILGIGKSFENNPSNDNGENNFTYHI